MRHENVFVFESIRREREREREREKERAHRRSSVPEHGRRKFRRGKPNSSANGVKRAAFVPSLYLLRE